MLDNRKIGNIIRAVIRGESPLNVIVFRSALFDDSLYNTGHNFFALVTPFDKPWGVPPPNLTFVNDFRLPPTLDFDLVISPLLPEAQRLASSLQLPLIVSDGNADWPKTIASALKN